MVNKPILCLDFDGVVHSYTSPWTQVDEINDPPTEGAFDFISAAQECFAVYIYSSRSAQPHGVRAMEEWVKRECEKWQKGDPVSHPLDLKALIYCHTKPPAFVTLDDRAITFTGKWPMLADLLAFKPWNKK